MCHSRVFSYCVPKKTEANHRKRLRYFIERFQGTPEGSQSTREATLSGAMRGILRSGRRGALKRDFVFASLFRNNIFIHEIPFIHKKTPAVTGVFLVLIFYFPVFSSVQNLSYMVIAFPISWSHSPLSAWLLAAFRIGLSTTSFFCSGIALALALGTRM